MNMLLFLFIDLDICDLGKSGNCPIYTYKSTYVDLYVYMYIYMRNIHIHMIVTCKICNAYLYVCVYMKI